MSIGKKLKREGQKFVKEKLKQEYLMNKKRFEMEETTTRAQNGETYQRYWMGQHVIATKCKLTVRGADIIPNARTKEELSTIGEEVEQIKGTVVDAIEIANFTQWLDNQRFYVVNETPDKANHDLWYMMQFSNFAPNGMPRVIYLEPVQGTVDYSSDIASEIEPESQS